MFFLELLCFLHDSMNAGNLISGSSAFSIFSLNICKFLVHILLKPSLKDFDHNISSMCCCCKAAKLLQSCLTLCDPIDSSPPGSPISGILQARTLEWVAISFCNAWKWKVKVKSLSHVRLRDTPWTAAYQAPLSMGFSRQEYWSGVPLPSPSSMWNECNYMVVWTFFGIFLLWDCNENWTSPALWPLLSFPNLLTYWVQYFINIIFKGF